MNDEDLELLHRVLDGEVSSEEAAEFEARLENSPELAGEREELMQLSAMLRQDISAEVDAVDFSQFYAGIEAQLPDEVFAPSVAQEPAPTLARAPDETSLMDRVRAWFQRSWTPLVVGAVAAAAVAVWVMRDTTPVDASPDNGPVYVDAVSNQGKQTVLISMPAEESGATVIWLLDEEDEDTKRKHDLRVERMERLEKQRQDQAKYWAKYQAKKLLRPLMFH